MTGKSPQIMSTSAQGKRLDSTAMQFASLRLFKERLCWRHIQRHPQSAHALEVNKKLNSFVAQVK